MIENINIDGSNVTAELHALMYDYVYGYNGVFNYGQKMSYEIVSNNEIRIKDGLLINQGRFMRIVTGSYEAIPIENGTSGVNRIDLIVARFETDGIIEKHSIVVKKGTGSTEPTPTQGNTFGGATVNELPLYAVHITGLAITSVVQKFTLIESVHDHRTQLSNPNLLINGDFKIWQRGTSFVGGTNLQVYTVDRWWLFSTNTTYKVEKHDKGMKVSSSTTSVGLYYTLEYQLITGEKYTLSAKIDGGIKTVLIIGGTTISKNGIGYKYEANKSRIELVFEVGEHIVEWIKLEQGTIATPFVPRLEAEEMALCRRYYMKFTEMCLPPTTSTSTGTVYLAIQNHFFKKPVLKSVTLRYFLPNNGTYPIVTTATLYKYNNGITIIQSEGISANQHVLPYGCDIELDAEIY